MIASSGVGPLPPPLNFRSVVNCKGPQRDLLIDKVITKGCSFGPENDKGRIYQKKLVPNLSYPTSESNDVEKGLQVSSLTRTNAE